MTRATAALLIAILVATLSPTPAAAHALNGSLAGRYTPLVERYRPRVVKWLKHYGVHTKTREGRVLNIIRHESSGRPSARGGSHVGLMQFTPSWKHDYSRAYFERHGIRNYQRDNRRSGDWSIRRIAKVYKDGGDRKVIQHWKATYYR